MRSIARNILCSALIDAYVGEPIGPVRDDCTSGGGMRFADSRIAILKAAPTGAGQNAAIDSRGARSAWLAAAPFEVERSGVGAVVCELSDLQNDVAGGKAIGTWRPLASCGVKSSLHGDFLRGSLQQSTLLED